MHWIENKYQINEIIASSDVVIVTDKSQTNHLNQHAVSIGYRPMFDIAPRLTGKCIGEDAYCMKTIAENNNIIIVKKPLLAIALYELKVEESIPENLYTEVAEILAYVYKRKNKP